MSNYPQYFLTTPIAASGDKTIPPATAQEAGTGRLSQEQGWFLSYLCGSTSSLRT